MYRFSTAATLGLLAAVCLLAQDTGRAQDPGKGNVTLKVVKYAGLADEIARHRGKVVVVDFWADY